MKNTFTILTTLLVLMVSATVFAADNPTCIMMKFTNDTRYKNIDSASLLSDMVMEKLLASGKINLQENRPIDEDIETALYNEIERDILNAEKSMQQGDFNLLFESDAFDPKRAQSISTAEVGQIISPEIISAIGNAHNAEYLIQGTIIGLGTGERDEDTGNNPQVYLREKKSTIGVIADVRLIKVETGEVIWQTTGTGTKSNSLTQVGMFKFGSAKLNSEMYNAAMERTADEIVENLLKDLNAGKLFVK